MGLGSAFERIYAVSGVVYLAVERRRHAGARGIQADG